MSRLINGKLIRRCLQVAAILVFLGTIGLSASAQKSQRLDASSNVRENNENLESDEQTTAELIILLIDPEKVDFAVRTIVARGKKAVPDLISVTSGNNDLAIRGWAIVCLSQIGGKQVDNHLLRLHANLQEPALLRIWAAAARVHMVKSSAELLKLSGLVRQFPSLSLPIATKLQKLLAKKPNSVSLGQLLRITMTIPELHKSLSENILSRGPKPLVNVMISEKDVRVCKEAAGFLEELSDRKYNEVAAGVNAAYQFDPNTTGIPWSNGQLVVPGLKWQQKDARKLVRSLISWNIWCEENLPNDRRTRFKLQRPIEAALKNANLATAAGYRVNSGIRKPDDWLLVWGRTVGKAEVEQMLQEQNLEAKLRYKKILNTL